MTALWRHVTVSPIALWILIGDLPLATFFSAISDFNPYVFLITGAPAEGAIVWIAVTAFRAQMRRGQMRNLLHDALGENGEVPADVALDGFPDIPLCVSKKWLYCARAKDIDAQRLDQIAWAYGESFMLRPWAQLAIWNRTATANVLPLRKADITPALERIRQAAPWLPVGYNTAMKETWNADHRDFLALIDGYRHTGRIFDAPWAGRGVARVAAHGRSNVFLDNIDRTESREQNRLTKRWKDDGL